MLTILLLTFLGSPTLLVGEPPARLSHAPAPPVQAPSGSKSFRRHFVGRDKHGNIDYQATEITAFTNTTDGVTLLLWDAGTARAINFVRLTDFAKKLVTYRIEEADGKAFVSVEYSTPFVSTTREGTLKEARGNPILYDTINTALTISTNSYRRTATETQWSDARESRAWRSELRSSMSPSLLESVERLRGGMLAAPTIELFHRQLLTYIFHGGDEVAPLSIVNAPPDCDFDAEMDHPCSEAQLQRLKERERAGKLLDLY